MFANIVVVIFVLFHLNGGVAATANPVNMTLKECQSWADALAQDYMEKHKGDTVIGICLPINKKGVDYATP